MKNEINICGDIFYIENGFVHNDKGPAIIFKNGNCWYMVNGKLHKDNGPAIIDNKEILKYWIDGKPASDDDIVNIKRNKWIDFINKNENNE